MSDFRRDPLTRRRFLAAIGATALAARASYTQTAPSRPPQSEIPVRRMPNPYLISLSPDGQQAAYVGVSDAGQPAIWVQPLDGSAARILPGTENAMYPFWSPDSRSIAFGNNQVRKSGLKRIDASGSSPAQVLADLPGDFRRGSWGRDGTILFATNNVQKIPAAGGAVADVTDLDPSLMETSHSGPWFLPDGRHFIFKAWSDNPQNRVIYVGSLDSKTRKRLIAANSRAIYAAGHILYSRGAAVLAQPFDASRLEFTGEPVQIVERVIYDAALGIGAFEAFDNQTLIYRAAPAAGLVGNPPLTVVRNWTALLSR